MRTTLDLSNRAEREFPFSVKEFRYLASLVYERSGIVLAAHKQDMVYARLARRLRSLGLSSFQQYCELIQSEDGASEIGSLINAITTNLTRFFREIHHFEHLREVVLKESSLHAAQSGQRRLRIWSAGCSSGEEPYSIAMMLMEGLPGLERWDARILATDLDTSMVEKAATGCYPESALHNVPRTMQLRYFETDTSEYDTEWTVASAVRRLITFKQLNLLGAWPMSGKFDAIFCRNVMIYFDAATKAKLVSRFAGLLKPRGWLYVGHSESLLDNQSSFELKGRTIYQMVA